jgi:hypothetical protein
MVWNIRMDLYNLFFRFKHLMISVLVIIFGHGSRDSGEEFSKNERVFSQEWVHIQKPLSIL